MERNLAKIRKMAELKEEENQEFRMFLKRYDHHQVDRMVHQLNQKYLAEYDCRDCGSCCKKLAPGLTLEETEEIAGHLDISYEDFSAVYIERRIAEGYMLKGRECPFLENNKCSIYICRPEVCRSFPHLHKDNINHRLYNLIDNSYICPIVYNVLEDLKDKLWDRNIVI